MIEGGGGTALSVTAYLRAHDDVGAAGDVALRRFGAIDTLINKAGTQWLADLECS